MKKKIIKKTIINHDSLSFEDEWVVEAFEKSPVYPVTIIGDMMYYPNEEGDRLDWLAVRMEVVRYNNDEISNEKTITIRAVPEQFPEEEKDFSVSILEKRTFSDVLKFGYVYNNSYLETLISYMQESAAKAPHYLTYNRIGWKEEKVKTKNGTKTKDVFRTNKLVQRNNAKEPNFKYDYVGSIRFDSQVIIENYIEALNTLLTTKGLQLAIVAGLSSVILARMNMFQALGSIIIHVYGDSSRGKTTFLKAACSCWGNPNKTPLVSSWNATPTAILTTLVNNFGVAIGLDEASSISNDFSKLIYSIANGVDKKRATKELNLVETGTWCTTVISTAEESLLNNSNRNNGLKIRCIEFFNLYVTENAEHAEKVNKFVQSNFGVLGEMFAKVIIGFSRDRLEQFVNKARVFLKGYITRTCNLTERLSKTYAILLATAKIAKDKLGLNISLKNIREVLLEHHEEILKESDPAANLYECIMEYISVNRSKFPPIKSKYDYPSIEGLEDKGFMYISKSTLEKIMNNNGFSDPKVAVGQLAQKGYLIKNKDRYLFTKRVRSIPLKCYKITIAVNNKQGKDGISE